MDGQEQTMNGGGRTLIRHTPEEWTKIYYDTVEAVKRGESLTTYLPTRGIRPSTFYAAIQSIGFSSNFKQFQPGGKKPHKTYKTKANNGKLVEFAPTGSDDKAGRMDIVLPNNVKITVYDATTLLTVLKTVSLTTEEAN